MSMSEKLPGYEKIRKNRCVNESVQARHIFNIKNTIIFNIDDCTLSRLIPLPVLESYPMSKLSYTQADFISFSVLYPELAEQFLILENIKNCSIPSFRWVSTCILTKGTKKYIHIVIKCNMDEKKDSEEFLHSLGL